MQGVTFSQLLAIGTVVGLSVGGCSNDSELTKPADRPDEPLPVLVEKDMPYTTELAVDVYRPDASGPWPMAVVFPGGEEHKEKMATYATRVAEQGVVVVVAEYHSYPNQVIDDPLAVVEDGPCAVRFARARASEFDGVGDRVVAAGFSLGGDVAAITVLAGDQFEADCLVGSEISGVADGLVGIDAVFDFAEVIDGPGRTAIFSDEVFSSEEMRRASAINLIEPAAPSEVRPFVLFTGMTEELRLQAQRFHDDLTTAGYQVTLIDGPGLPHSVASFPEAIDALVDMAYG